MNHVKRQPSGLLWRKSLDLWPLQQATIEQHWNWSFWVFYDSFSRLLPLFFHIFIASVDFKSSECSGVTKVLWFVSKVNCGPDKHKAIVEYLRDVRVQLLTLTKKGGAQKKGSSGCLRGLWEYIGFDMAPAACKCSMNCWRGQSSDRSTTLNT